MSTLFGTDKAIKSILSLLKMKIAQLKSIVIYDKEVSADLQELASKAGITVLMYHQLIDQFKNKGFTPIEPNDDALEAVFTISYTSGTSGNSKGVMLTNSNFLSAIATIKAMTDQL